jgi:DNA-binding NarL/FixJ family response regulator
MIQGLSDREIAAVLFILERMIRSPTRNMLNRLDVGDRLQLMCYAKAIFTHRRNTFRG